MIRQRTSTVDAVAGGQVTELVEPVDAASTMLRCAAEPAVPLDADAVERWQELGVAPG